MTIRPSYGFTREDRGHWVYKEQFNPDDYEGFIYKITCVLNNKFYIGRKNFKNINKLPPLKDQKRKRTKITESDWKTYTSSSNELNELIGKMGAGMFRYEILQLCTSKSEMAFYEVYHIIHSNSMTDPNGLNKNASKIPCRPKGNVRKEK